MRFLHIILPIIVGGAIGYCTNYIAIRMMFRPHKAIYIGKHRLPFTPGIIPKNQKRLAGAIGDAVSEQLLTKEDILKSLEEAIGKFVSEFTDELFISNKSIIDMLPNKTDDEKLTESASTAIAHSIIQKVEKLDIDSAIKGFGKETIGSILSRKPMLSLLFSTDIENAIYEKLSNAARGYIKEHGEEKLKEFTDNYIRELSHKPLGEFIRNEEGKEKVKFVIRETLGSMISEHGATLLEQINIKDIVVQRIEAMEVDELEELVLSVMKQELQAVINLGAVIGALIGIINIFL